MDNVNTVSKRASWAPKFVLILVLMDNVNTILIRFFAVRMVS